MIILQDINDDDVYYERFLKILLRNVMMSYEKDSVIVLTIYLSEQLNEAFARAEKEKWIKNLCIREMTAEDNQFRPTDIAAGIPPKDDQRYMVIFEITPKSQTYIDFFKL